MTTTDTACVADRLLSAHAVRERCTRLLHEDAARAHFNVHFDRLDAAADYVVETIRINYPDLSIPFHARWRHFSFVGEDRWQRTARGLTESRAELARIQFDLVVSSVLLDAGAGSEWRYHDHETDTAFNRSEGLALASLNAFTDGLFSSDMTRPLLADARGLQELTTGMLATAFQVRPDNQLEGLEGRVKLMNALGATLDLNRVMFPGDRLRVGNLFDFIVTTHGEQIAAAGLLQIVLRAFGCIWPGRLELGGVNLGDTWKHPGIVESDYSNGLIPFHKLSQWLTYSLIEPLQNAGITVKHVDGLTGLAEYRNGGLFLDLGVLELRDASMLHRVHKPGDGVIVEWRALTVALLDRIAVLVRDRLKRTATDLPLASVLEGGTWAAGRRIAKEKRVDASPPLQIVSDGSVF